MMSKVRNGNQKGHKRFRELRRTPSILNALFIKKYVLFVF